MHGFVFVTLIVRDQHHCPFKAPFVFVLFPPPALFYIALAE